MIRSRVFGMGVLGFGLGLGKCPPLGCVDLEFMVDLKTSERALS